MHSIQYDNVEDELNPKVHYNLFNELHVILTYEIEEKKEKEIKLCKQQKREEMQWI